MQKLKQENITVNMRGKSYFEIESLYPAMDSINVMQNDSSEVKFEMSPDYRKSPEQNQAQGKIELHDANGTSAQEENSNYQNFDENMSFKSVTAIIKGYSILDIGHAQINNLNARISDSSAIVLSGGALKKIDTAGLKN